MNGSPHRLGGAARAASATLAAAVLAFSPTVAAAQSFGGAPARGVTATQVDAEQPTVATPPTSEASAPPSTPSSRCMPIGFSSGWELAFDSPANIDRWMNSVAEVGGTHVRFVVDWSYVEPAKGTYDWSKPDRLVASARAHGLTPILTIAYTPPWARAADGDPSSVATHPARASDYADFARNTAARYRQASLFELWNEPNHTNFWKPTPNATQFAELVRAAYPAIKSARPDSTVIVGGLAAPPDDGRYISAPTFVEGLYANGLHGNVDAISFHPYNYPGRLDRPNSWDTMGMADRIHRSMTAHGDGDRKIWFTEYGVPTGTNPRSTSETEQGGALAGAVDVTASRDYLAGFLAYTLKNYGTNTYETEQNFGILRNDFSRKSGWPAVEAAYRAHRC